MTVHLPGITTVAKDPGVDLATRIRVSDNISTIEEGRTLCSVLRKERCRLPHIATFPRSHRLLAKIISQAATPKSPVPVNVLVLAKGKEPTTDALSKFLDAYTPSERVGVLVKEKQTGKMISEWNAAVEGAARKPAVVDMTSAISRFLAVKDEEEIASTL